MAESQATPWKYERGVPPFVDCWSILDATGTCVSFWEEGKGITTGNVNFPDYEANAALIVKAVNAHDDLVALVRDMQEWIRNRHHSACRWNETVLAEEDRICTCFLEPLNIRARKLLASLEPTEEEEK